MGRAWRIGPRSLSIPLTASNCSFETANGALFSIRGYRLEGGVLLVQRLGWNSRIDLAGLQSAEADPAAMNGSIRTFGNGGFFCFAGAYWNRRLRSYRAFVTHPRHAVVLRLRREGARSRALAPEPILHPDSGRRFARRSRDSAIPVDWFPGPPP